MDFTSLKIKFKPIMKSIQRSNTKCCIEIIPQIKSIENFNNLKWDEDPLIEYTIPITYKIVFKKANEQTKYTYKDDSNKFYYSCVDLLIPSALSNNYEGSGDLKRHKSDTIVLDKHIVDVFYKKMGSEFTIKDYRDDSTKEISDYKLCYDKSKNKISENINETTLIIDDETKLGKGIQFSISS